jgi:hypothetical protein
MGNNGSKKDFTPPPSVVQVSLLPLPGTSSVHHERGTSA